MAEFLTDDALTKAIREIVSGNDVKCAVAFWGDHRFEIGDARTENWQIVCDIHMGSTSPQALRKLGAPDNVNLKHLKNIHSKVYISDKGVVIGSANASAGGLSFDGKPARLLEAGTFHKPNGKTWCEASEWFAGIFSLADQVNDAALQEAESRYRPPMIIGKNNLTDMSILRQIAAAPQHYESIGVGFLICSNSTKKKERYEAAEQAIRGENQRSVDLSTLQEWPLKNTFVDWGDLGNLRDRFVEFFLGPSGGRYVSQHQMVHRFGQAGHFYTETPQENITQANGRKFPTKMDTSDWEILEKLLESEQERLENGAGIFSAGEFAEILRRAYFE